MNGKDPYLEYYRNEEGIFSSAPINIIFLDTCSNVSISKVQSSRYEHVFTLVLQVRQLSLVAPSRQTMLEWANTIEEKLMEIGCITVSVLMNISTKVYLCTCMGVFTEGKS